MPRATCPVGWRGSAYDRKRIAARVAIPHQQMMNPPTSSTIELTASRTIDTVYLVAAGLLCAACLFSLYSFTGFDPAAIQKGDAFTTALDLAGPAGMRLIFAVAGVGAGRGAGRPRRAGGYGIVSRSCALMPPGYGCIRASIAGRSAGAMSSRSGSTAFARCNWRLG
jgi:hypothetical protein